MKKNEKIWSLLVHLSMHHWADNKTPLKEGFHEDFWDYILEESVKSGINNIVLDLGDAVQYGSHPEIADEGAWSRKRVRQEVRRCRELGIDLIPKLNFATPHCFWLGEYRNMVSTNTYYKVCDDLIKEVYDLFEAPEYIHLGLDEEDARHNANCELAVYRQGELYWHDTEYLMDCVHALGAMPWIWSCPLLRHPEEYVKRISPDDAVLSPWYYNAFRKEHWTPVESRAEYVAYYNEGQYKELGIKYVEEDPYLVMFRDTALPLMEHGYKYIPCASVFNRCEHNHNDLIEYFRDNAPDDQILGYMTAPWLSATWDNKEFFDESFKAFKDAREKFYK